MDYCITYCGLFSETHNAVIDLGIGLTDIHEITNVFYYLFPHLPKCFDGCDHLSPVLCYNVQITSYIQIHWGSQSTWVQLDPEDKNAMMQTA